ncbi:MAG: hypothetical protein LBJ91_02150 [Clostridiales Family XIII bacterium]|jgi:hypothetical protein|nr:hypothetical protein [Clostridiales Family XIII bacterium]
MIKMQILMDEPKILREKRYDLSAIYKALDDFFVGHLHLIKRDGGFYVGRGSKNDFGNFGRAMWTLQKHPWFIDNVDTWLYFNSEDSDDPNDFVIEDFKAESLKSLRLGA